jgi:hypothetical protein
MSNIISILDKKSNNILYATGILSSQTYPFLQTGINNLSSGISFIKIRSSGTSDRSSLAGSGVIFNIDEPIDLFYVIRMGQNLPSPFSSSKRYMNLAFIVSGTGLIGVPTQNYSELTSAYQFPNGISSPVRFFLGTRNLVGPRFQVDFANIFNTGSFSVLNWVYNGDRNSLGNGVGNNSQSFLFNNVTGNLVSFSNTSIPTGFNELESIGYTGRVSFGQTNVTADVVQDYFFGEKLVFNRVLSTIERQFVFNYLSGKWGI